MIEGIRRIEHCASHTQTNKQKSVRKVKVGMAVVVLTMVMIGSRVKEDMKAKERSMKRGRKEGCGGCVDNGGVIIVWYVWGSC